LIKRKSPEQLEAEQNAPKIPRPRPVLKIGKSAKASKSDPKGGNAVKSRLSADIEHRAMVRLKILAAIKRKSISSLVQEMIYATECPRVK